MRRSLLARALMIAAASQIPLLPAPAAAQSGIPGSRLETARDHRAAVHAETYVSVAQFFAKWREVWQAGDTAELKRLYDEDASVRLPGQAIVRGRAPLAEVLQAALAGAAPIAMADVDFHTDGETAVLVSCYFTRLDGRDVTGVATAVLLRTSRSWRLRVHVFDVPHAPAPGLRRFSC